MSTTSNKRQLASGISIVAIAAALSIASPAYAQAEFGTLQGHVDGARAGTQVLAVDKHTGQQSTGTVDARGNYSILGLRASDYSVSVGGKSQDATVQVGQTVNVDFLTATAAGNIVVTGRRTAQPVVAQTVATNITAAQIENLPQNARNFLSFAVLAPGITLSNPSGAVQFQAGALNADHSNVILDGMSFKNPINHGGMFGQNFGSFGNPFPEIAIQEYQVETQNFGAEVGNSAGAVLNAITKTGGDKFHGSAFIDWQPKAFIEKGHFQTGPKQDFDRKQFGGELGGPIIPGKLTFYIAGEGTIQKLPAVTFNVNASVPGNIAAQVNSSKPQSFKQGLYFGKLTWFATPDDTVNLIGYVRRQSNLSDYGGNAVASHGHLITTDQTRGQAQWRHTAGNFLNLLNVSYDKSRQGTPTVSNGPEYQLTGLPNCTPVGGGAQVPCVPGTPGFNVTGLGGLQVFLGNNSFVQDDHEKSWTFKDDATYRAGEHTLKAGAQVIFYDLSRTVNSEFNGTYFVANPCPPAPATVTCPISNFDVTTAAPYAAIANIQQSPTLAGKDTLVGLYVQDEWKPDLHWTINAGLRWDYESNPNDIHYVTPPAIAAALRAYPGWQARGINANDFISTGSNRHPRWNEFQPRLGVSYDVHGDHDLVVFGGAGRYYDESLFIEGQIEQQMNSSITLNTINTTVNNQFVASCTGPSPAAYCHDPAALRQLLGGLNLTGGAVWVLPNKLKTPYSDQFDLGVRKQFGEFNASLTYSHVESHNLFMFVRSNFYNNGWASVVLTPGGCINGGDNWINDNVPNGPFPNCPATGAQLAGFNGKLDRGVDSGRARLDALYFHFEKPFTDRSIWGFTESFTLQRARTNVGQDPFNQDEMFNGSEIDVFGWNYVPNVPKWSSVTSANWRAPWGIILSGILSLNSGPAFGHIVFGVPNTPQGACCIGNFAGVFFPHKTFGYKRLDLRVAKTFKMPWGHEATIDFQAFNVFNWLNRTYSTWGAGSGNPPPLVENGQVGNDQRQFQVGLKYKF
ncbi:MAG: TonB-dependent receptor domain-containing protein [Sphingomicrobium sp.]